MPSRGGRVRQRFPVGVYATLLIALLALLQPRLAEPVERGLRACAALPFRAWGRIVPHDVAAAAEPGAERAKAFWLRTLAAERTRRPRDVPTEFAPVYCAVRGRRGGDRIELDCAWREVDGCEGFATVGATLVGFTAPRGADDELVEVVLLGADDPSRPVPALCERDGGVLRFVVEPAASIDPWPLRCGLLEDPYAAARMEHDAQPVVTSGFPADPLGWVPAGLRIGELRIWGYDRDGDRLPIGFFVDPAAVDEHGLVVVTLWRRGGSPIVAAPRRSPRRVDADAYPLAASRWFASIPIGAPRVAPGDAVVRGERLVGTVSSAGPGHAIVAPVGIAGSRLDAVFVPVRGAPVRLVVRARGGDDAHVAYDVERGAWAGRAGALFTNAAGLPPGLWIGDVAPGRSDGRLVIARPQPGGGVAVLIDEEGAR